MSFYKNSWSRRGFLAGASWLAANSFVRAAEPLAVLPSVNDELQKALQAAPLRMTFRGKTAAEFAQWQLEFAAELRRRIGPHEPPQVWNTEQLSSVTLADHTREEYLLKADGVPSLPLYVLRPLTTTTEKLPIVLALHGHGGHGHDPVAGVDSTPELAKAIESCNYDYGRRLVREGYLVVCPCFTPFGRRLDAAMRNSKADHCAVQFVRLAFLGRTLVGENLRDVRWALNFASQRPDARQDRVACVGLSYGGRMTMIAAALEPRIRASVISGALNVFQERAAGGGYSCGAQVIPGLLEIGDTPEIGSLIAPRPCIWELGSRDALIVKGWSDKAIGRLQRAYAAAGVPERLQFHRFEGGHEWNGKTATALLAAELKGV